MGGWYFSEVLVIFAEMNLIQAPGATPHHMILLADPQLIDPHTYPGRPWPLSKFTEMHTDNYLKRSYIQLQKTLHPDTVVFLGDLFDGGREWTTRDGNTDDFAWADPPRAVPERRYAEYWKKHYGDKFWLNEYRRFGDIFFKHWMEGGAAAGAGQRGRKLITGLPGNHDIGFGTNSRYYARQRFRAYFGETNRVDVIANHTFVSVDGLSLSAKGSTDPAMTKMAEPVDEFLQSVKSTKRRAEARELRHQRGEVEELKQEHVVSDIVTADFSHLPTLDPGPNAPEFPTILFTHVPLWRNPGTPCGPQREHWPPLTPPAGQTMPVNPDDRNSLPVSKGYQYQTVLSEELSTSIVESVGDVVSIFSGDDHDYCEIRHPKLGNIQEITVKSMSWAMGVREPGFLMVSLWNPLDPTGHPVGTHSSGHGANSATGQAMTLETHLCFLPDQISIFLRYVLVLCISLIVLIIRAILVPTFKLKPFAPLQAPPPLIDENLLLPISNKDFRPDCNYDNQSDGSNCSTSSTGPKKSATLLAPRSTAARTRSVSPGPSYGHGQTSIYNAPLQAPLKTPSPPLVAHAGYYPPPDTPKRSADFDDEEAEWGINGSYSTGKPARRGARARPLTKAEVAVREMGLSIWRVAWVVGTVYLYLVWHG